LQLYNLYSIYVKTGLKVQKIFKEAVAELEKLSCVRFVKRTVEKDYVRLISDPDG